ncbi:MAG: hypothetical protein WB509_01415, partial [Acetobacteraceae bacterium]
MFCRSPLLTLHGANLPAEDGPFPTGRPAAPVQSNCIRSRRQLSQAWRPCRNLHSAKGLEVLTHQPIERVAAAAAEENGGTEQP